MRPQVNVVSPIFVIQDFAISRHEYRNGVCEQQHSRGHGARHSIEALVTNSDVFEFHGIH
jgi:hypothetical protein